MQKRKGISLIVLVITIIVMIILAGAIILSLNNAGIIGKANQAVDVTNEANVKTLADLKWSEAYLAGKIGSDLVNYVVDGMKEALGEDVLKHYYITVTDSGATVEKLVTLQELQAIYEFEYYNSLISAVEDINAGTIGENAVEDKTQAVTGIYTIENTNNKKEIYMVILKDVTESETLRISEDVTINLGGKTIIFESIVGISGVSPENEQDEVNEIIIDGRLPDSKIICNGTADGTRTLQTQSSKFIVKGGTYIANTAKNVGNKTSYTATVAHVRGHLEMHNANVIMNNLVETGEMLLENEYNAVVSSITNYGIATINNCTLKTMAQNGCEYRYYNILGVRNEKTMTMVNSSVLVDSNVTSLDDNKLCIRGLYAKGDTINMDSCKINVKAAMSVNALVRSASIWSKDTNFTNCTIETDKRYSA